MFGFENFLRLPWFLMGILSLKFTGRDKKESRFKFLCGRGVCKPKRFQTPSGTNPGGVKTKPKRGLTKPWRAFKSARNGKVLFSKPQPEGSFEHKTFWSLPWFLRGILSLKFPRRDKTKPPRFKIPLWTGCVKRFPLRQGLIQTLFENTPQGNFQTNNRFMGFKFHTENVFTKPQRGFPALAPRSKPPFSETRFQKENAKNVPIVLVKGLVKHTIWQTYFVNPWNLPLTNVQRKPHFSNRCFPLSICLWSFPAGTKRTPVLHFCVDGVNFRG